MEQEVQATPAALDFLEQPLHLAIVQYIERPANVRTQSIEQWFDMWAGLV